MYLRSCVTILERKIDFLKQVVSVLEVEIFSFPHGIVEFSGTLQFFAS